jgi:hypothetical protein
MAEAEAAAWEQAEAQAEQAVVAPPSAEAEP